MPTDPLTASRYPDVNSAVDVPLDIRNAVVDLSDNTIAGPFANAAARDTAYAAWVALGNTMRDGLHCVVGGYRHVYRGGFWNLNEALPPVIAEGNSISTRTDNVEDSWFTVTVADPGARYRIEANATGGRLYVSGAGTYVQMRIRAGQTGGLDTALPTLTFTRNPPNTDPGNDVVLPNRTTTAVISGTGRIVGFGQRTSGTGSWVLSTPPSVYYRVVPA